MSPTLSKLLNAFKNFSVEAFSLIVHQLVGCGDLEHLDISIANVLPKEVPLDQKIPGSVGDALLGSKQQCSIVVLKDTT